MTFIPTLTLLERLKPEFKKVLDDHSEYPAIKASAISSLKEGNYVTELRICEAMSVIQIILDKSFNLNSLMDLFNEQVYIDEEFQL
jgi:hypothetical protein